MSDPVLLPQDAELLLRVFRVKLTSGPPPPPPALALSGLAAELAAEQASAAAGAPDRGALVAARWSDLGQRRSLVDRAIMSLLSEPVGEAAVADQLAACYGRGLDERRRLGAALKGGAPGGGVSPELLEYALELCVSYCVMALTNPLLFAQPAEHASQGATRLLYLLEAEMGGGSALPSGFLQRLAEHAAVEGVLDELAGPVFGELSSRMGGQSILSSFAQPLRLLVSLLQPKPFRLALVQDARFMPRPAPAQPTVPPQLAAFAAMLRANAAARAGGGGPLVAPAGAAYEASLLGGFFRPSGFPAESVAEMLAPGGRQQSVAQQLFAGSATMSRAQLESNLATLRLSAGQLAAGTHAAVELLLKAKEAQQPLFAWMAGAISANAARAKDWCARRGGANRKGGRARRATLRSSQSHAARACTPPLPPQVRARAAGLGGPGVARLRLQPLRLPAPAGRPFLRPGRPSRGQD